MAERTCRLCGCTEGDACCDDERGACSWAGPDVCSHCAGSINAVGACLVSEVSGLAEHHLDQLQKVIDHRTAQMTMDRANG